MFIFELCAIILCTFHKLSAGHAWFCYKYIHRFWFCVLRRQCRNIGQIEILTKRLVPKYGIQVKILCAGKLVSLAVKVAVTKT